tara:strand:+ start:693 stop:1112 length:420 start_codon:yes stop_codon:yes gene_type:complete
MNAFIRIYSYSKGNVYKKKEENKRSYLSDDLTPPLTFREVSKIPNAFVEEAFWLDGLDLHKISLNSYDTVINHYSSQRSVKAVFKEQAKMIHADMGKTMPVKAYLKEDLKKLVRKKRKPSLRRFFKICMLWRAEEEYWG